MRSRWQRHGEAITTALCGVFVVAGLLVGRAGDGSSSWASSALFLAGYVAGGYRQAIEGTTRLVVDRELEVDLLMVVAAIGAAAIGYWFDGALLIFIFALSGTLEGYASARTQRDIESLMALNPEAATVFRDGRELRLPVTALLVGDLVVVKPGERIPADGHVADALATATVGIAMGVSGTDVALDTADVVLMADDVSRIPYAIELGRRALRVVKQNLIVALSVIALLVTADVLGRISLPTGVVGHEGSTLLVTLSGLRLLRRRR